MSQVARFDEAGPPVRTAGHPSGRKSGVQAGGENTSDMAKGAELRAERSLRKGSARTVFRLWIRREGVRASCHFSLHPFSQAELAGCEVSHIPPKVNDFTESDLGASSAAASMLLGDHPVGRALAGFGV